jgi:hypothetical protein
MYSFYSSYNREEIDINLSELVYQYVRNNNIKYRAEGSYVSLYSNELDELKVIGEYFKSKNKEGSIVSIHSPVNQLIGSNIALGKVYVKNIDPDFKYKIIIKPAVRSNFDLRKSIYDYLNNFQDQIKFSRGFVNNMTNANNSWWQSQVYFYSKTDEIFIMLKLIAPNMIEGIYELVRE